MSRRWNDPGPRRRAPPRSLTPAEGRHRGYPRNGGKRRNGAVCGAFRFGKSHRVGVGVPLDPNPTTAPHLGFDLQEVGDDPGGCVGSEFALHDVQFAYRLSDERVAGLHERAPEQVNDKLGVP